MKTVIVTGASSGIGAATARIFSENQYKVILLGRKEDRLAKVSSSLNADCSYYCVDMQNRISINEFASDIKTKLTDGLDALINNAGIAEYGSTENYPIEGWDRQFQVNLFSAVELTNLLFNELKKKNNSTVVNISSTLAFKSIPNTAAYSASKAAMDSWTKSIALEWAPYNIRVNAINPGIVNTPIHTFYGDEEGTKQADQMQPLKRSGKPEEIAELALFLCSKSSEWTTGSLFKIDGGIQLL